ncbi:MAG: hypothetical protein JXM75_12005 [Chromatiaceae bacterium]|nr:hypothetical protein [Chromatiaceae bacterium]
MSMHSLLRLLVALGGLVSVTVAAQVSPVQFSADMVNRAPDGQLSTGRLFVGDERTRVEKTAQGRELVHIVDRQRRAEWMLFPAEQTYMERLAPPEAPMPQALPAPSAERNPCAGIPDLSCRRAGEESVAGRAAVKWEMTMRRDGQTLSGAQWLDVERGLPLKYAMPDGQRMELRLVGNERLEGRAVEKWEMTASAPGQQAVSTFQWYDPELKLLVREEFPGGAVRELTNIRVGAQPDELFSVPAGYRRVEMPQPPR